MLENMHISQTSSLDSYSSLNDDIAKQVQNAEDSAMNELYDWVTQNIHSYPTADAFNTAYQEERQKVNAELNAAIQKIGASGGGAAWDEINKLNPWKAYNDYADEIQKDAIDPMWSHQPSVIPKPPGGDDPIHDEIEKDYEKAEAAANQLEKDINQAETQASTIEAKINALQKEIEELEQKAAKAPAGSQTAKDLAALKKDLATLSADQKTVADKLSTLKEQLSAITKHGGALDQLEGLANEAHPSEGDLEQATMLLKGVSEAQTSIEEALSSLPDLDKDFKAVTADIAALHHDMPTIADEIARAKAARDQAAAAAASEKAKYGQAESSYELALQNYQSALEKVNACTDPAKKKAALEELAEAEKSLNAAKKALDAISSTLSDLEAKAAAASDAYNAATQAKTVEDASKDADKAERALKSVQADQKVIDSGLKTITTDEATASSFIQKALSSIVTQDPAYPSIKKDGVSVVKTADGFIIPLGGFNTKMSTSEAFGYAMRNAVANGDKEFYQELLNSYYHFCNLKSKDPKYKDHFGLMPWQINTDGSISGAGAATDGDQDIIQSMIDAYHKFGDMTATDGSQTMPLKDLIHQTVIDFSKHDLTDKNHDPENYPTLAHDDWNDKLQHPDYFDPETFSKMINFLNENYPSEKATADLLEKAKTNTMDLMFKSAQASNGWIVDQFGDPGSIQSFNAEGIRSMMRLGQYVADKSNQVSDPANYQKAVEMLKNLVHNLMESGMITKISNYYGHDAIKLNDRDGMAGTDVSGPLLLAMDALKNIHQLPGNVNQGLYDEIRTVFNNRMNATPSMVDKYGYPTDMYYGVEIGLICRELDEQIS